MNMLKYYYATINNTSTKQTNPDNSFSTSFGEGSYIKNTT
jgi:hypothetical protein